MLPESWQFYDFMYHVQSFRSRDVRRRVLAEQEKLLIAQDADEKRKVTSAPVLMGFLRHPQGARAVKLSLVGLPLLEANTGVSIQPEGG